MTYAHEVDAVTAPNEAVVLAGDQDARLAAAVRQRDRLYTATAPHAAAPDDYSTGLDWI